MIYFSNHIARPLSRLERFAGRFKNGDLRFTSDLSSSDQLTGLTRCVDDLRRELAEELDEVNESLERIEESWQLLDRVPAEDLASRAGDILARMESELGRLREELDEKQPGV